MVTSIQYLTIDDGKGIRTTVFLKGCPLRCPWCCNPETQSVDIEYYRIQSACNSYKGSKFCGNCHGLDDVEALCVFGAKERVGYLMTSDEIEEKILHAGYKGVTFSGGEPLLQAHQLLPLLSSLKSKDYHIAFETALAVPPPNELMPLVDQWIVDLKLQRPFYYFSPKYTVSKAEYRLVLFSELLKDENWLPWLTAELNKLNVREIQLLGYHSLGRSKYEKLNRDFTAFTSPSKSEMNMVATYLEGKDIKTSHLSI